MMTVEPFAWVKKAACRGLDPNLFFPQVTDANSASEAARATCAGCEVREVCLETNLDQLEGVWGGTTPRQRRQLRADRREAELAAQRERMAS